MRERLVLILAALAAFGYAAWGSFHFDDYSIFSSPVLTSPSGWWEVWKPLETRPLTQFTFWLDYQLWGGEPAGYHAVNLALHLAAALLLWELLRTRIAPRAALLGAAFFAVHPIQSEAVAYVFARAILIAAVFCLLAALAWSRGRMWLAVALFAVALMGKEEAAAFPVALWLLDRPKNRGPLYAMLALSLAAGLRVIWAAQTLGREVGVHAGVTPWEYLAAQGYAICRYLQLVVAPWGFTVDALVRPSALAWVLLAAAAVLAWRKRWLPFTLALILLIPSSSVFPAADLSADRRMYLPMLALSAGVGLLLARWRWAYLVLIPLTLVSVHRMTVWRSERTLWEEAVRRAPEKARPKIQLARALGGEEAIRLLREAPGGAEVFSELGTAYLGLGRPAEALTEFGRALALTPRDPRALNNRGAALLALGQTEAARRDFERALALDPCLFEARLNLRAGPGAGCRYTPEQQRALAQ